MFVSGVYLLGQRGPVGKSLPSPRMHLDCLLPSLSGRTLAVSAEDERLLETNCLVCFSLRQTCDIKLCHTGLQKFKSKERPFSECFGNLPEARYLELIFCQHIHVKMQCLCVQAVHFQKGLREALGMKHKCSSFCLSHGHVFVLRQAVHLTDRK